ncbi:porin family protein [Vibrio sp. Of14-4]|uniref:outer membrane beta-barrel protein n=1 Tax=Vibrio sp. Of14-4 TaxID=2724878 RepID=UPI001EF1DD72|nr:outer membrane beta-barrel protein [Vibrio sp. Of14-4]MCG7490963.1 porin family protein [Vibrio sp. Of14-4]
MQNKTVKLFALGALAAATTFGASAENTYDYFVGFDAGTHVSGKYHVENSGLDYGDSYSYNDSVDTDPSFIAGISGGAIINDHHRIKLNLAYDALDLDGSNHTVDRTDLSASYDYMLPIANKLNWTVGAHMGYEFFQSKYGWDELDGFTYGVQTGLDYRLTKNWSIGTEIAYTVHDETTDGTTYANGDWENYKAQIEDDVTVMANVQYHF